MYEFKFDKDKAGHMVKSNGRSILALLPCYNNEQFLATHTNWPTGREVPADDWAILTGFYQTDQNGQYYYQIESDVYYGVTNDGTAATQWTLYDKPYKTYSMTDAQKYIDGIIANNRTIYENNLLCAHFAAKLNASQRQQVFQLQQRLEKRNSAMLENNNVLLKNIKQSYPKGYINFYDDLQKLCDGYEKIGVVISASSLLIIGAVVLAAAGTAAYFAYKAYFSESEQDVKFSDELTKILQSKLTEEEYEQLKNETAGIVTKAKLTQKLNLGGTAKTILSIGLGVGVAYVAYRLIRKKNGSKEE